MNNLSSVFTTVVVIGMGFGQASSTPKESYQSIMNLAVCTNTSIGYGLRAQVHSFVSFEPPKKGFGTYYDSLHIGISNQAWFAIRTAQGDEIKINYKTSQVSYHNGSAQKIIPIESVDLNQTSNGFLSTDSQFVSFQIQDILARIEKALNYRPLPVNKDESNFQYNMIMCGREHLNALSK